MRRAFPTLDRRGVTTLLAVLIVGSVTAGLSIAVGLVGVSDLQIAFGDRLNERATAAAHTCIEEAAHRLRRNDGFTSTSLTLNDETQCELVISGSGSTRNLQSTGTHQDSTVIINAELEIFETANGAGRWVQVQNIQRGQ